MLGSVENPPEPWRVGRTDVLAMAATYVIAFGVRFGLILASAGGLRGNLSDDAAAYYAGADALVHGRLPYRDFVLLHPPLLDVLLTPFAAFGALTSDDAGFVAATIASQLAAAGSAVLVILVARRLGLGRRGAYAAGAFYAVWYGAVASDMGIRLESTATFVTLLGFMALTGRTRRRNAFLGGLAIAASAAVKIWGAVPLLVIIGWGLAHRRTRPSMPMFVAGAAAGLAVICGPFFVAAPNRMWHMVVLDQLTRKADHRYRVQKMTGLFDVFPTFGGTALKVWLAVIVAFLVVVFALAVQVRATRLLTLLALAELVVLIESPSFFSNYDGFAAAALAITVGSAAHATPASALRLTATRLAGAVDRLGAGVVALVLVGAVFLTGSAFREVPYAIASQRFPHALMARAVRGAHCPTPDGPIVLIETNTLSSTLGDGCPNWIDVSGRLYDVDKAPQGASFPRAKNKHWQRDLRSYLLSGDVVIIYRPKLGIGPKLRKLITSFPLIGIQDGFSAYRVPPRYRTR